MNIEIHLWGVAARQAGRERLALALPDSATVADAARKLAADIGLTELSRCAFAVGDTIVPRSHVLRDGDELAVLPPVSGG